MNRIFVMIRIQWGISRDIVPLMIYTRILFIHRIYDDHCIPCVTLIHENLWTRAVLLARRTFETRRSWKPCSCKCFMSPTVRLLKNNLMKVRYDHCWYLSQEWPHNSGHNVMNAYDRYWLPGKGSTHANSIKVLWALLSAYWSICSWELAEGFISTKCM